MVRVRNNVLKFLGTSVLFVLMSITVRAQGTAITSDPPSMQNNTISGQDTSFNQHAQRFANDLAQQTGLSSDKVDELRTILIDYHNEISETRSDFLRGMRDPRSQGDDESRRDVTGGQTGEVNNNMPGGSSGTGTSGSGSGTSGTGTGETGSGTTGTGTGTTGTGSGTSGTDNTGTTGTGTSGTGNTGTTGTGSSETGSAGVTGSNRSAIEQDLISEYRKADEKADEKILDVFENDSQKEKYVQIKRQWWQSVKDVVYSTANENSGATETR